MYRFERKYYLPDHNYLRVRDQVLSHPLLFRPIFKERKVNNIYLDTPGLKFFYDNVEGEMERKKIRVRWYGESFQHQEKLTLEYKIKKGLLGRKESYPLKNIDISPGFAFPQFRKQIRANKLPFMVTNEVTDLHPTLLNTYVREYFLSEDGSFRITLDRELHFYHLHAGKNMFRSEFNQGKDMVMEIKYDPEHETKIDTVTQGFPFRITKSSKYVIGIQNTIGA